MIYGLKGKVFTQSLTSVVLDVNGVYYEVRIPSLISYPLNSELFLYTYHVVREDEMYLIGFNTAEERELFLELLSVNGIGPKTAQSALAGTTPQDFRQAIITENIEYLKKLPGIGPKSASQIILDLKGKLVSKKTPVTSKVHEEVLLGLLTLGFKKPEITKVLSKFENEKLTANDLLKKALGELRKL